MDIGGGFSLIGTIKEFDDISDSISYSELLELDDKLTPRNLIVDYLESYSQNLVLGWMGYTVDPIDGAFICPSAYFTDGKFVWPGYYSYYLRKFPAWKIDPVFLQYVGSGEKSIITDEIISTIEEVLINILK